MKWRVDWLDTAVQWTEEHLEEWRRDVGGESRNMGYVKGGVD